MIDPRPSLQTKERVPESIQLTDLLNEHAEATMAAMWWWDRSEINLVVGGSKVGGCAPHLNPALPCLTLARQIRLAIFHNFI